MYEVLSPQEEALLAQVEASTLMEYTRNISKEVRLSGSDEERRAFEYAKVLLDGFGLQTELYFRDSYISLPVSAELVVAGEKIPCITHSMSVAVNHRSGTVIDVGAGAKETYDLGVARGQVALVDGLANPQAVKDAMDAGAIGAIFVNARLTNEMITTAVWGMPTPESANDRPTLPIVSVSAENGHRLRELLQQGEDCACVMTTVVDTGIRPIPTLIAELRGTVEPENFILFSGHIDSWHYGAMDNGTANAVMLEVARILAQSGTPPRRSLRLAFWSGHSHGRYAGSTWYCDEHWEELREHCYLHVNIDSVGAKHASVLTRSSCMAETKGLAADVIAALTGEVYEGKRITRMGDQSFWGTGTPSLFVSMSEQPEGGLGWWWHTTEDTMDKVDPPNLVRDCKVYLLVLLRALFNPVVPVRVADGVTDVLTTLESLREQSGEHLDLRLAVERGRELREKVIQLFRRASASAPEVLNRCILDVSAQLVPMNYVFTSAFDHDRALNQPPIPKLADVSRLAELNSADEEYHFLRTALRRRLNEVNWSLKCAIQAVDRATRELS